MAEFVTDDSPAAGLSTEVKPTFRCLDCGVVYKEKRSLKEHLCKDANARPFVCDICKKDFTRQDRLTRHRRIHTGERPYNCGCCLETFARTERLKKHMQRIHGTSKLVCSSCNLSFERWTDFQKHVANHPTSFNGVTENIVEVKQEPEVEMNFGKSSFGHNMDAKYDFLHKPLLNSFWCSSCGEGFMSEQLYHEHLRIHRNEFCAESGGMSSFYQQLVSAHMMGDGCSIGAPTIGYSNEENFHALDIVRSQTLARMTNGVDSGLLRCVRCYKILPFTFLSQRPSDMDSYQQPNDFCTCHQFPERPQQPLFQNTFAAGTWVTPEERKPKKVVSTDRRTCYECGELLSSVYALVRHVQSKHVNDRPYVCCECDKAFTRRDKLGRHFLKHPGVFQYTCTECGITFSRWIECRKHMRLHRLSCNMCRYQGSNSHRLVQHMEQHAHHTNTCNVCGTHFSRAYQLAEHLCMHTGDLPYVCKHCGKGFAKLDYKNNHERLHAAESGLACLLCGKTFSSSEQLSEHKQEHSTDDRNQSNLPSFICATCSRQFKKKYALQRHQLCHTGERPYPCPNCGLAFTTSYGRKRHVESVHNGIILKPVTFEDQQI